MARLGIDVGGTFIDLVVETDDGAVLFEKALAEPSDLVGSIIGGVRAVLALGGVSAAAVTEVVHATTRGSNTVLERSGPTTALVATRGFRDVLQIQRALRWSMYDVQLDKPVPLVPRSLSFEVNERMLADGTALVPLAEGEVEALAPHLRALGIEAVAVAFLHSYANPVHEQRAAALLRELLPGVVVTTSSEVSLQAREYERANTAVVDAYVSRSLSEYLARFIDALPAAGIGAPVWIMQSSGGLASVREAAERPVRTIESGPAAGVVASAAYGVRLGYPDVISFDMGGTTAKAAVVSGGIPTTTSYFELERVENRRGSGLPVDIPALDLVEIGTGGGSIAEVRGGTLHVGPRSAAADPGPACYGRGGTDATVTDANLLLGYYDPATFAGGLRLDIAAAEEALGRLAADLGTEVLDTAWGVHQVATLDMEHAIRLVSINRGFDPRGHAVVCLGGAGPAHGPRLGRALGARVVLVPPAASGGSAQGLLDASESVELTRTAHTRLDAEDAESACAAILNELVAEARTRSFGATSGGEVRRTLGMRYAGQGYELLVPLDPATRDAGSIAEAFHCRYERAYGYRDSDHAVEVVTWHIAVVQAGGPRAGFAGGAETPVSRRPRAATTSRSAFFPETGTVETAVHDRSQLRPGDVLDGPCLVSETTTTTVVLPGDRVEVAPDGTLIVRIEAA